MVNNLKIILSAIAVLLGVMATQQSLAQTGFFKTQPDDFDRLLTKELHSVQGFNNVASRISCGSPQVESCAGHLGLRFANPTITPDPGGSTGTITVEIQARAGQEAAGTLAQGAYFEWPADSGNFLFIKSADGTVSSSNPANVMYSNSLRLRYSKELYPGNTSFTDNCTVSHGYGTGIANAIGDPDGNATSGDFGVHAFSYGSNKQASNPATLTPPDVKNDPPLGESQLLQWRIDEYQEVMTVTCNLPAEYKNKLLGMSFHSSQFFENFTQHAGANESLYYLAIADNNLQFFPLNGANYIVNAEITEGGDAILVEFARPVDSTIRSDSANTYRIIAAAAGGEAPAPAPEIDEITLTNDRAAWLNSKVVWLDVSSPTLSSVYDRTAYTNADYLFIVPAFPNDTQADEFSFAPAGESTYRVALTRNFNPADRAGIAPAISSFTLGPGSSYVDITFAGGLDNGDGTTTGTGVWGSNQAAEQATSSGALTADHFEVMMYSPRRISPSLIAISSIGGHPGATGYTSARLNLDFEGYIIEGDEHIIVRTARRARFSDRFITDRTIFSHATIVRETTDGTLTEYTEALSGVIHLQSGALLQLVPPIYHSIAVAEGTPDTLAEGEAGTTNTFTFTISRNSADDASSIILTIEQNNPDGAKFTTLELGETVTTPTGGANAFPQTSSFVILLAEGVSSLTGTIIFEGNDDASGSNMFTLTLSVLPSSGGDYSVDAGADSIFFTVKDDNPLRFRVKVFLQGAR